MENQKSGSEGGEYGLLMGVLAVAVVFFVGGHFYNLHKREINGILVKCVSAQFCLVAPFSEKAAVINANMKDRDPAEIELGDLWALANYSGRRLRWVFAPLCLCLAGIVYFRLGRVEQLRRKFTMQALLKNNVKIFPELSPIVNRERPITDEPHDSGPWRTARTPLQFALENKLIVGKEDETIKPIVPEQLLGPDGLPNKQAKTVRLDKLLHLDLARAEYTFASQLGDTFKGLQSLNTHQKGLAAALLAYAHSDRTTCNNLLDQLALSFRERPKKGSDDAYELDINGAEELLQKYPIDHDELQRHASYVNCWMSALLEFARGKGVIACSKFLWVRPIDRSLWYALNQCGRRVAWSEAAGVRAHIQSEEVQGAAINTPQVESAVRAIESDLIESGYIFEAESVTEG